LLTGRVRTSGALYPKYSLLISRLHELRDLSEELLKNEGLDDMAEKDDKFARAAADALMGGRSTG
jgi:hypothetical protein